MRICSAANGKGIRTLVVDDSVKTREPISQNPSASSLAKVAQVRQNLVELVGIEPTTSSLRTMRSPS